MNTEQKTPPTAYFTHSLTNWSVVECAIVLGQGRTTIMPNNGGPTVDVAYAIDWMSTISLSPPAAYALFKQLEEFAEAYQRKYGAFPDPALSGAKENVVPLRVVEPAPSTEEVVSGYKAYADAIARLEGRQTVLGDLARAQTDASAFNPSQDGAEPVIVPGGPEKPVSDPSGGGEDGSGH